MTWQENEASAHSSAQVKSNTHSNLPGSHMRALPSLTGNVYFTSQPETHIGCDDPVETNTSNPPGCPVHARGPRRPRFSESWLGDIPPRTRPSAARLACTLSLVCPVSRAPHVCEPCMWHRLHPAHWPGKGLQLSGHGHRAPSQSIYSQTPEGSWLEVLIFKQEDVQHLHHMK